MGEKEEEEEEQLDSLTQPNFQVHLDNQPESKEKARLNIFERKQVEEREEKEEDQVNNQTLQARLAEIRSRNSLPSKIGTCPLPSGEENASPQQIGEGSEGSEGELSSLLKQILSNQQLLFSKIDNLTQITESSLSSLNARVKCLEESIQDLK